MNFRKEVSFVTVLKCSLVVFTFVLQFYGNIRGMLYLNLEVRQICVNICHLLGVVMVRNDIQLKYNSYDDN